MLEKIDYVEKEPIYKNSYIPNDTYHSGPEKWYHDLINSEDAWDISLGSEGIKIAIVDNAVATNHADFSVFNKLILLIMITMHLLPNITVKVLTGHTEPIVLV